MFPPAKIRRNILSVCISQKPASKYSDVFQPQHYKKQDKFCSSSYLKKHDFPYLSVRGAAC